MTYHRNNLAQALSPYLRQHAANPVWWQAWSADVLAHARSQNKPLFVSVGYSTCHWCHVMAGEAFSDPAVADYLNRHFVSIKVDREERPDIDIYLMRFIVAVHGSGGWPLNAFLTPDLEPVFALTYASVKPQMNMPGFLDILRYVERSCRPPRNGKMSYFPNEMSVRSASGKTLLQGCQASFDVRNGGFGNGSKFPPHSTLLFLLYHPETQENLLTRRMLQTTLDAMITRGLCDHLQGGLFRYCVDREWTIPHFEKMLYDQAMALWVYSLAYQLIGDASYEQAALKLVRCLNETFALGGLYRSAIDADTAHEEGGTYLWAYEELMNVLSPSEWERFSAVYSVSPGGQLEGKNHLIKKEPVLLTNIEEKLLQHRNQRRQPGTDDKIMTSWNALTGIAFVHSWRYLGREEHLAASHRIARLLWEKHVRNDQVARCSVDGVITGSPCLEDAAALMLLFTFLQEETGGYDHELEVLSPIVRSFQNEDGWMEARSSDFLPVQAGRFDHPIPSSTAMAEWALARFEALKGNALTEAPYLAPLENDISNITALLHNGLFHLVTSPHRETWKGLPVNTLQRPGEAREDCYNGACRPLA